jgi:hypothetical protein
MEPRGFTPLGAHVSNGSLGSAVILTAPAGADFLMLQALGNNIRFRLDGVNPTTTVGFQLANGDTITLPVNPGDTVRVIQEAATATIQYQWGTLGW